MERQAVRLARQELYEKMWSRPAIALAEEFGISGRGLGKICSRFKIRVPPRGYWAKLAAGKHVTRIPLPTAKSDVPSEILIQPSVPTKNSENVEKSGDLFRSAVMSPACSHFSRNSSHGSPVGFAAG